MGSQTGSTTTPHGVRRRASAEDVARLAGTSQSTVSRVFSPGAAVSPALRQRVLEAARQLGYRPDAIARSLILRRSRIVALAMAHLDNLVYPELLERLSAALQAAGYQILLFTAPEGSSADPVFEQVMRYRVDGILLASTTLASGFARECRAAGVPVVSINRTTDDPAIWSVTGDNERGGRAIAEFLLAGGHRRFAFLAGSADSSTNRDRERGFATGLAAAGLGPPVRAVGNYSFEEARRVARVLLRRSDRPDALFCANDPMAIACLEVARCELGLRVPEDLSIVGFDDAAPAAWPSHRLTTWRVEMAAMAEAAVAALLALIEQPDRPVQRIVLPGRLVVRGSARRPPPDLWPEDAVDGLSLTDTPADRSTGTVP